MEKIYQTIIIGAGVAGLTVARYLKDALVLDEKEEIGKPVKTGEGLSTQALKRVDIEPDDSWISVTIDTIQRITSEGKIIGRVRKGAGYIIDRTNFEKFLSKKSKAKIQLKNRVIDVEKEGDFWEVKTKDGKTFKAKYLIGAEGANSIVRTKIFSQRPEIIATVQYLVELEKEIKTSVAQIYWNNEEFPHGYAWIFPKSRHSANIGLGGKGRGENFLEKFKEFLEKIVRPRYGNYKLLENRSGTIPIGGAKLKLFKDNAMLVGDAAGLADPIFKGGMGQAMLSAKIAAECILKNEAHLYESKIKSLPFADGKLLKAADIFYSLDNKVLDELGEILENRGTSYLKTLPGIVEFLSKPYLRKNFYKILKFFSIWWKNRDYLW